MASQVLPKLLHGQDAAAAENFAVTLFFLVFGAENCAHHRTPPLTRVTLTTLWGFVTWYAQRSLPPRIFTRPPAFVSRSWMLRTPPASACLSV
jgi:hypothetical protein